VSDETNGEPQRARGQITLSEEQLQAIIDEKIALAVEEERERAAEAAQAAGEAHVYPNADVASPTAVAVPAPVSTEDPDWPRYQAAQEVLYLERERDALAAVVDRAEDKVEKARAAEDALVDAIAAHEEELDALDGELQAARDRLAEIEGSG
jgi:hypothetical protein